MQNLEFNQTTIDSRQVAEMLEKEHSKLLRDIETYSKYFTEAKIGLSDFFLKSQYIDSTGRTLPCYQITKKGCEFLAHKLTGAKGATFTAKYINAFDEMSIIIKNETKRKAIKKEETSKDGLYFDTSQLYPQIHHNNQDLMTQALLQILNTQFDIKIAYEQAISMTAFLTGFKTAYDLLKLLDDKDFVSKTLSILYK